MMIAKGPRTWPVHLFAVLLLAASLWNYLPQLVIALAEPDEARRISLVAALSAQFCIVAIPVTAIWLFASRIAKWLFTALSIGSFAWIFLQAVSHGNGEWALLALALVTHLLWVLLFTPSASAWFAAQCQRHVDTFN